VVRFHSYEQSTDTPAFVAEEEIRHRLQQMRICSRVCTASEKRRSGSFDANVSPVNCVILVEPIRGPNTAEARSGTATDVLP